MSAPSNTNYQIIGQRTFKSLQMTSAVAHRAVIVASVPEFRMLSTPANGQQIRKKTDDIK